MTDEIIRTLIDTINSLMTSDLPDSFFEMVLRRLDSFGYEVTEADAFGIAFSVQKSEMNIKNDCNITEIPEGLYRTLCDMSCGDFLQVKYQTGKLNMADINIGGAIASISEGDTSITFENSNTNTDEGSFATLISELSNAGRGNLACYRRFKW